MGKLNPERLVFGAYLLVLILVAEVAFGHFGLPAWPAFMVMIFFFVSHMDIKQVPAILVGGSSGLASLIVAKLLVEGLSPSLGAEGAKLFFVAAVVYAIIAFGEMVPTVFNNYLFMFLTVGAVAAKAGDPNPFLWIAVELLGGTALIFGIALIGKLMALHGFAPSPPPSPATAVGDESSGP